MPFFLLLFTALPSLSASNNHGVLSPIITSVTQDAKGFIWLATLNGLIRHDSEENITFNNNNNDWPLPFNWVNDIALLADNKMLLATETHKLWLFDALTGQGQDLAIDIQELGIYHAIEYLGHYYISTRKSLYRIDPATNATVKLADNIDIDELKKTEKHLYIATSQGLFQLVDNSLTPVGSGNFNAIETVNDAVIIAQDKSMILRNDNGQEQVIELIEPVLKLTRSNDQQSVFGITAQGSIKKFSSDSLQVLSHSYADIAPSYVKKLFHDSSDVLWVMSNQGVKQHIPSLTKNHPLLFDIPYNSIALTSYKGQLMIGSFGAGLHEFGSKNNAFWQKINESFSSRAKIITDLVSVDDILYISTFDGLWQFTPISNSLSRVDFLNNTMLLNDLTYKNGLLYITTDGDGVLIFDTRKKIIIEHVKGTQLSSNETINVLPVADDHLWIATAAGINIFEKSTKNITKIALLGENKVISLLESNNKIFVATKGDGFFVYNKQGELLSHFAKNLSFGYMTLINDQIWVSGQPGLYRIDPNNYQLIMLPNTLQYTFTQKPVMLNDTVYIGHYGGIVEIPLKPQTQQHSKIYISKTIVSGKAELLSRSIELASANDVITLELASLDFRPGQEKLFKYQINKGNWHEVNGNHLTLTGLSPGNYHIEIMGTNSLRQWSNFRTYADISVAYPWYWRTELRIIYAVLLISIICITLWSLYLRSKSISHIHSLLSSEIKLRGKSALNVRRNLTSAIDLLGSHAQQVKIEHEKITQINALLSESIDELSKHSSSDEPSSLSGSTLPTAIPYLADYFHHKYQVLIEVNVEIDDTLMDYALQAAIYKIVYEAMYSAIVNGNSRKFSLSIKEINEKVWLDIIDNEQSFTQFSNKINFNMAMYCIRQVANKYNATFHTFDNREEGSQLVISIPLV